MWTIFLNFSHLNLTHPSLETKPTINQANLLQEATFTVFITVLQKTVLHFTKPFIEHLVLNQVGYTELWLVLLCAGIESKCSQLNDWIVNDYEYIDFYSPLKTEGLRGQMFSVTSLLIQQLYIKMSPLLRCTQVKRVAEE